MNIEGCFLTPLRIIPTENGEVMHAMKNSDPGFAGFGEAYFSAVDNGQAKGWKKHSLMVLNLTVPVGAIRFVLFDDRPASKTSGLVAQVVLSPQNYQRLTVAPGVWMAFQGVGKEKNLLLNLASIPHQPDEAQALPLQNDQIPFDFSDVRYNS